jgi:predicted nucleic acid-binding protein
VTHTATPRVLVDTSAWVEALRASGAAETREAVRRALSSGVAVLCDMVRLELWNGAGGDAERRMLRELESELESVPTTAEVWTGAVDLAGRCRAKGLTVPATDLLVIACAREHRLQLLHRDVHFDQVLAAAGAR